MELAQRRNQILTFDGPKKSPAQSPRNIPVAALTVKASPVPHPHTTTCGQQIALSKGSVVSREPLLLPAIPSPSPNPWRGHPAMQAARSPGDRHSGRRVSGPRLDGVMMMLLVPLSASAKLILQCSPHPPSRPPTRACSSFSWTSFQRARAWKRCGGSLGRRPGALRTEPSVDPLIFHRSAFRQMDVRQEAA